ncbi:Golgi apyrase [Exophiala dermatitidis]|uniref:Apyrase n=2 Tax=Exophiala dermatitidis TaxID=5970 RepID=H6BVK0_EXODN|nr:apyrase [Exophiala dermatitidis NIH/UT8656]KAJ4508043.1 Golgi apyrase [Exophiala dermatitidis]EHY55059.1 apyrase [Exophiala dermatitidis NIH/UT8656]KAJ4510850.1 Golgi apyrase [Exophiala dermatitidis]KAJ4513243.1 Golgi apyrase [Exophiala dermatitidis]KAJ4532026.1 Golgi apyrase [Exophiala dermatitidis]
MVKAGTRYGVVLDAGSSGTRVYIYRWLDNSVARLDESALHALPELETNDKWTKKIHPGVSTFGDDPESVGPKHLKPLLKHALKHIPKDAVPETPVFLLATAGMRLLPEQQQRDVLRNVCSYIQSETKFLVQECDVHIQVIPGETEGLYGWIAANYLLGAFNSPGDHDHGKGHHTYGFLDMGGASAQIAFAPNATEAEKHANDLTLLRLRTVDGVPQEHRVFVTTWLGFGANEARRRYVEDLGETYGREGIFELPDPCLPKGLKVKQDGTIISARAPTSASKNSLVGTGNFEECLRRTFPLLEKDVPCPDEPCLVHGVHVPAIDFDVNHFIGISEYWHTTHDIFEMEHQDKAYDFNTYQNRVKEFCEKDWSAIEDGLKHKTWGKGVDDRTAMEVCFKASWLINMLHEGIGIPRVGIEDTSSSHNGTKELLESGKAKGFLDPFQAVNKIKSTEVSWTLGKMILYASAEIPPATDGDLPVGFGSNVPGIPKDFQYPSGGKLQDIPDYHLGSDYRPPSSNDESQSLTDQIHDTLFNADAPHRLPGFIFFLLILFIATFYLCGRDRRARFYHSLSSSSHRMANGKSSFLGSLFHHRPHVRDLEDGTSSRLYDPSDFELENVSSASSSDDDGTGLDPDVAFRNFKSSAAPTTASSRTSPSKPKRNLGRLTPDVMDRRGLVVRTESRERLGLDPAANGRSKSRTGSPTRL